MSQPPVLIQVPASTSNCGPGFDTLGIALSLYNFVRLSPRDDGAVRGVSAELQVALPMVEEATYGFAQVAGLEPGGFDFDIWGEVPRARGLGSSATIRGAVVAGLNELTGRPLDREGLIRLTAHLDNAADNACAAFAGGFCIARTHPETGGYREHVRFPLSEALTFVAVAPDYEVMTDDARQVLPERLPFKDAVRSANSLAFLVGVLASGDFARLEDAVDDCLHQPYREHLNPFGHEAIEAGRAAGAYCGWLSGSGSTVVCVCESEHAMAVGKAMHATYDAHGTGSRVHRLHADNAGLRVAPAE